MPSGYGVISKGLVYGCWHPHYDVRVLANYGTQGGWQKLNGVFHYPALTGDEHGDRTARLIFRNWNPDIFVTLYDVWMGAYTEPANSPMGIAPIHPHWVAYVMVDHDPVPEGTLAQCLVAYRVVTPTRWGQDQLVRRGVNALYIPFGVESDIYKPAGDKGKARMWLEEHSQPFNVDEPATIKDSSFIVSVNGANKDPYRKGFDRMLIACQLFLEQNPDAKKDFVVYIHSWMKQARDIPHLAHTLHIEEYCRGSPDYHMLTGFPPDGMALMYGASDVFLHLSEGGGFELPILEALSCGVPVVGSDFVGMTELVKDHGWLVPAIRGASGARSRYFTPLDATAQIDDEFIAASALGEAYNHPDEAKAFGEAGRSFALDYDWGKVKPMWIRLFEEVRAERSYRPLEDRLL